MDKEIVAKTINEENQRCKNMNYDEMGKGYSGLMVKCTPERGHNALFFIPLQVLIVL